MDRQNFFAYDNAQRRQEINPDTILADIGLKRGQTFVDVGCGQGFFAIPAAKIVGRTGKVYALDLNADFIDILRQNLTKENLHNVSLTVGPAEDTILCDSCADIVFLGQVLHDFADPAKVLTNALKTVKPTGRLVNVDWKKQQMRFGPPLEKRFDEQKASHLIESAGFKVDTIREASPYQYIITAKL
jgi:ubiquinone/menaquinone biosynthesis C-methylase UbiE